MPELNETTGARSLGEPKFESFPENEVANKKRVEPSLGNRIVGWTNNLIATSIVLIVALVGGSQLVSLWDRQEMANPDGGSKSLTSWPALESCTVEFGNRPYGLKRHQIRGHRDRVFEILSQQCRDILQASPTPVGEIGPAESKMLKSLIELKPIGQDQGHWRLYGEKEASNEIGLPTVIGIRDDCEGDSPSRMVVWGIALAQAKDDWTALIYHPVYKTNPHSTTLLEWPLPEGAIRTLAISDAQGGTLIGFTGGPLTNAMRFFDQWAEQKDWIQRKKWQQLGASWQAHYEPRTKIGPSGVRIQLTMGSRQTLRGMLIIDPTVPKPDSLSQKATE